MGISLTAALLLVVVYCTSGADVKIIKESEPWPEKDTTPHMLQAEEKLFYADPCPFQKTCGACVRADAGCRWCASKDMRDLSEGGSPRCLFDSDGDCPEEDAINLFSTVEKISEYEHNMFLEIDILRYIYHEHIATADHEYIRYTAENVPPNVQVSFRMKCPRDEMYRTRNECKDIKKGDYVKAIVSFKVLSCPENRDKYNQTIWIHEWLPEYVESNRQVSVNLHMNCECPCERPENSERNSPKCSGRGTYHCGVCTCPEHWYGKSCECARCSVENTDYSKQCIPRFDYRPCCGRGRCRTDGTCECFNKATAIGPFCEIEPVRSNGGQICGGGQYSICGDCLCKVNGKWQLCD